MFAWRRIFTTGSRRRCPGVVCLTLGVLTGLSRSEAHAASDVMLAAVALGRLHVMGTTERPNTPVSLDGRYHTTSDKNGTYSFEEIYHPATCIVGIDIEDKIYQAVVSNCTQETSFGPLPFVGAALPRFVAPTRSVPRAPQAARIAPIKPKLVPEPLRRATPAPPSRRPPLPDRSPLDE